MSHRRKEGRVPKWLRRVTVHVNDKQAMGRVLDSGAVGQLDSGCTFHVIGGAEDDWFDFTERRHRDKQARGEQRRTETRGRILFWMYPGHHPPMGLDAALIRKRHGRAA